MYNGSEIVTQEECKIVLAEFFEGVECYNKTDNTIKFTLKDIGELSYDELTHTMTTRNFSCRPIILPNKITVSFEAKLLTGTTGLEVIMHTGNYTKTRIMPISYLPQCNRWINRRWNWRCEDIYDADTCSWYIDPGKLGPFDNSFAYVKKYCIDNDKTELEIFGELDYKSSKYMILAGVASIDPETRKIELLDSNKSVLSLHASYSYENVYITQYVYNKNTGKYDQEQVLTKLLKVEASKASYIRFGGLKGFVVKIAPCSIDMGDVRYICNMAIPEPGYTQVIVTASKTPKISNGVVDLGNTKFKLLPSTVLLNDITDNPLQFNTASRIVLYGNVTGTYDIKSCMPDIGEVIKFCSIVEDNIGKTTVFVSGITKPKLIDNEVILGAARFRLLPETKLLGAITDVPMKFELASKIVITGIGEGSYDIPACTPGLNLWGATNFNITCRMYLKNNVWLMNITVTGAYKLYDDTIIDESTASAGTKHYTWYTGNLRRIAISAGIKRENTDSRTLTIKEIPVHWCWGDCRLNGEVLKLIPGNAYDSPPMTHPRLTWEPQLCEEVLSCKSAGLVLPTCMTCHDTAKNIITIVSTAGPDEVCECGGLRPKYQAIGACVDADPLDTDAHNYYPLGQYPYIGPDELTGSTGTSDIYFMGTKMFLWIDVPSDADFFVYIGDLKEGIIGRSVYDNATQTNVIVSFYAFVFLHILKIPYKYLTTTGLDITYWYDEQMGRVERGLIEWAKPGFDFKVPAGKLQLPTAWGIFDWKGKCYWAQNTIKRAGLHGFVITKQDVLDNKPVGDATCDTPKEMHHFTSNVLLYEGLLPTPAQVGALQPEYDNFVDVVSLLVSKDAEAFAYELGKYIPGQEVT